MALGDYLVAYLKKIGVTHLFGILGNLVINLFLKSGRPRGLKIVTLSPEPGVGFAADGYARSTGRIGTICVTYGAGEFPMTGGEIVHTPRYKLNPIVVLLHNGG